MFLNKLKIFPKSRKFAKFETIASFHKFNKLPVNKFFYKFTKKRLMDFDPAKDYYKILGLDSKASEKEIKLAYHKFAKMYHPDLNKGKTTDEFKEMSAAYDILSDVNKKKQYDDYRNLYSGGSSSSSSSSYDSNYNTGYNQGYNTSTNYNSNSEYSRNQSSSGFNKSYRKTTYTYRDPKTGEYKPYKYEGDSQGNPFFKDFDDFMKKFHRHDPRYMNQKREEPKENLFKGSFHDPYNNFKQDQKNPHPDQRDNFNPQWTDPDYFNYLYAKRIFTYILIFTSFVFFLSYSKRRRENMYYNDYIYQPLPIDYTRVPYPPGEAEYRPHVEPSYNNQRNINLNDPYVNPAYPVGLRK